MEPIASVTFAEDVYFLTSLGRTEQLLVNMGYGSARVIDCNTLHTTRTIAFPKGEFSIYRALVSDAGERKGDGRSTSGSSGREGLITYLFSQDSVAYAVALDPIDGTAYALEAPRELVPTGLRWFSPHLHFFDVSDQVWEERDLRLVSTSLTAWDGMSGPAYQKLPRRFVVEKHSLLCGGLCARSRDTGRLGYLASASGSSFVEVAPEGAIDIAYVSDVLLAAFESQIVAVSDGTASVLLDINDAWQLLRVEAVQRGGRTCLAALVASKDYRNPQAEVTLYNLRGP